MGWMCMVCICGVWGHGVGRGYLNPKLNNDSTVQASLPNPPLRLHHLGLGTQNWGWLGCFPIIFLFVFVKSKILCSYIIKWKNNILVTLQTIYMELQYKQIQKKKKNYENTPIQIHWKFYHKKKAFFRIKIFDIFHISAQNIDCGYSLELPRRGGSNKYPQSMFLSRNKENNVYPCKPQFYYIKVGFKGVKII